MDTQSPPSESSKSWQTTILSEDEVKQLIEQKRSDEITKHIEFCKSLHSEIKQNTVEDDCLKMLVIAFTETITKSPIGQLISVAIGSKMKHQIAVIALKTCISAMETSGARVDYENELRKRQEELKAQSGN